MSPRRRPVGAARAGDAVDGEAGVDGDAACHGDAAREGDAANDGEAARQGDAAREGNAASDGEAARHSDAVREGDAASEGEAGSRDGPADPGADSVASTASPSANAAVAAQLQRLADYLVIGGYDPAHAGHYRRLALTVDRLAEPLATLRHQGRLKRLPGVGPGLAGLLTEFVDTGTCAKWDDWARRVPASVLDLLTVPGVGVKTARVLYLELKIDGLPALRRVVEEGWLASVPGLGPKTVTAIRRHLEARDRGEV